MIDDPVATFLHFGYLPQRERPTLERVLGCLSAPVTPGAGDTAALVGAGAGILRGCFGAPDRGLHVVPLSGGLDSRAVLAGLLAAGVSRQDVVAVTVGTPGTLDFDIAIEVATRAKVRHELIDLRHVALQEQSLQSALLKNAAASWAFDVFYHRMIAERVGADATYWSGFMGGELAGAHVPAVAGGSWQTTVEEFIRGARFCRGPSALPSGSLGSPDLPAEPWADPTTLAYGDQLDFGLRQDGYVRRTVIVSGYEYRTPFLNDAWVRFILSVPRELRRDERLFKWILVDAFPALFALPTKNSAGLRLTAPDARVTAQIRCMKIGAAITGRASLRALARGRLPPPFQMVNYLDFAEALRSNANTRGLVRDLVAALDERRLGGPWASGAALWNAHERAGGDPDLACALTLLASLELNLRVDAARPAPLFSHGP